MAIRSAFAFLLLMARMASAQGTTTFLSNIGQSSVGSASVGNDSWEAAGFLTGTNANGYIINSIQLAMVNSSGNPDDFTVMLYANRNPSGFNPGSSLATFMGPLDPSTSGTYTYNAPEGLTLSTYSTYFIVVTAGTPVATGAYQWSSASANSYNPMAGFSVLGAIWTSANGTSWSDTGGFLQYSLIGSVAPEPGVVGLLAVGGVVLAEGVRRRARGTIRRRPSGPGLWRTGA